MKVGWTGQPRLRRRSAGQPEGSVHFQYVVSADNPGRRHRPASRFTAEAAGDLDANGLPSFFAFVKPWTGRPVSTA